MSSPSPGYEFSENQNKQVASLAQLMRFFAYSLFLGGAMQALLICVFLTGALNEGLINIPKPPLMVVTVAGIVGMYLALGLLNSSRHFMEIVKTQGSDIDHLMIALGRLRSFFMLSGGLLWLLVIVLILVTGQTFFPGATEIQSAAM